MLLWATLCLSGALLSRSSVSGCEKMEPDGFRREQLLSRVQSNLLRLPCISPCQFIDVWITDIITWSFEECEHFGIDGFFRNNVVYLELLMPWFKVLVPPATTVLLTCKRKGKDKQSLLLWENFLYFDWSIVSGQQPERTLTSINWFHAQYLGFPNEAINSAKAKDCAACYRQYWGKRPCLLFRILCRMLWLRKVFPICIFVEL